MANRKSEPEITKRRVTMKSVQYVGDQQVEYAATDYVRPDHLDAYVADARTRWQSVTVSDEPDAGPGGYHGQTHVPDHLPLPDAGTTYPATQED